TLVAAEHADRARGHVQPLAGRTRDDDEPLALLAGFALRSDATTDEHVADLVAVDVAEEREIDAERDLAFLSAPGREQRLVATREDLHAPPHALDGSPRRSDRDVFNSVAVLVAEVRHLGAEPAMRLAT